MCISNGACNLAAIAATIIPVTYHLINQVFEMHLKVRHRQILSADAYELEWLDLEFGHQDNSPSNGHQGNIFLFIL